MQSIRFYYCIELYIYFFLFEIDEIQMKLCEPKNSTLKRGTNEIEKRHNNIKNIYIEKKVSLICNDNNQRINDRQ